MYRLDRVATQQMTDHNLLLQQRKSLTDTVARARRERCECVRVSLVLHHRQTLRTSRIVTVAFGILYK